VPPSSPHPASDKANIATLIPIVYETAMSNRDASRIQFVVA
jgi:hypothetical protein